MKGFTPQRFIERLYIHEAKPPLALRGSYLHRDAGGELRRRCMALSKLLQHTLRVFHIEQPRALIDLAGEPAQGRVPLRQTHLQDTSAKGRSRGSEMPYYDRDSVYLGCGTPCLGNSS